MTASFFQNAKAAFDIYKNKLGLGPHDSRVIQDFRAGCCSLLQDIPEKALPAETEETRELCRLGMEIAAEIAKTRICEIREDGCLITCPDICPENLRDICVTVSDQIAEIASGSSKMYIPPRLERTPPDSEKCMAVLRLYDLEKAQHNTDRQSSNRDINRLFGSRG